MVYDINDEIVNANKNTKNNYGRDESGIPSAKSGDNERTN